MLQRLLIKNYALIHQLDLEIPSGFSTITGETGAGKSILLGALSLVLGQRADTSVLFDPDKKCFVEAHFRIKDYRLKDFFQKEELDYADETILRREILPSGKSRAFINDSPVSLQQMKALSSRLVDIHSQHETLFLKEGGFQLRVLDSFADNDQVLQHYQQIFSSYEENKAVLNAALNAEIKSREEEDYLNFLFEELEKAELSSGEDKELESEFEILDNAEEIKQSVFSSSQALIADEMGVLNALQSINSLLEKTEKYDARLEELRKRIESSRIELEDINAELEYLADSIQADPQRKEFVENRLDLIHALEQKHHCQSIDELLLKKDELNARLKSITSLEEKIVGLKKKDEELFSSLMAVSEDLRISREKAAVDFSKKLLTQFKRMGMPDASLQLVFDYLEEAAENGTENVRFLFNANKGSQAKDIARVASGGELSRLMLAIKSLIAEKKFLPTILFDEIDTGISGAVAGKIAGIMSEMADARQVIVISHLPQIAARAVHHFKVKKEDVNGLPKTQIEILQEDERVKEIAGMLSGEKESEAANETARQLLNS